jgi:hypothetical protein
MKFAWCCALALGFSACGASTQLDEGDASVVWDDCTRNSECVIRPASCCGACGAATREDAIALNASKLGAYGQATCGDVFGCPACYMPQDATLIATCDAGRCKVVDLMAHGSTTCTSSSECRIRTNVCCECGGPANIEHVIAVNVSAEPDFAKLVCDANQACPECAPIYPSDVVALCSGGRCEAAWAGR